MSDDLIFSIDENQWKEDIFKNWFQEITGFNIQKTQFKDKKNNVVKLKNVVRLSKLDFKDKVKSIGANFISIYVNWDNEIISEDELGAQYLGTSVVFFPCYEKNEDDTYNKKPSGIIISMGMGSGGPGPDERLVQNPGHIRRLQGMIKSIDNVSSPIWFRHNPLDLNQSVPESLIIKAHNLFNAIPFALYRREEQHKGYGQYLYALSLLKFDDEGNLTTEQKKIIKNFAEFYFRERGWQQNTTEDKAYQWYNSLYSNNLENINEILKEEKFIILCGPPGTRKTETLKQFSSTKNINCQFHTNTAYQNFIGGIQPLLVSTSSETNKTDVKFEFHQGPFLKAYEKAEQSDENVYLLIDEINRADLSSVLGETIQLFEKTENYEVEIDNYKKIKMPKNLFIIATMNTADRNISTIDVAIRRRFAFLFCWPTEPCGENSCDEGKNIFNRCINLFYEYGTDEDLNLMPGGFYFLGKNNNDLKNSLKFRLIPLLNDYLLENRLSENLKIELNVFIQELSQIL